MFKVGCLGPMPTDPVSFARPSALDTPPSLLINRQGLYDTDPFPSTIPSKLKVPTLGHGVSTSLMYDIVDSR